MFTVEEICEEQERQYNRLMQEDSQYCHPESFRWGFEHGVDYALTKAGWHPASELPPVETDIVVWCILDDGQFHVGMTSLSEKKWPDALEKYVKRWCYPPEEE